MATLARSAFRSALCAPSSSRVVFAARHARAFSGATAAREAQTQERPGAPLTQTNR